MVKTKLVVRYTDSLGVQRAIEYDKLYQAELAVKFLASKGIESKIGVKFVKTDKKEG